MKWNKAVWLSLCLAVSLTAFSCSSTGGGTGDELSLEEAIEQSAEETAGKLLAGTRVAIVAFSSEHDNLSEYIMDELTGALVDGSLEVADRRNLEYVYRELKLQMSGDVSDENAVSIGKFLGARYVVTGQLVKAGNSYRYRLSGINVETAVQESSTRLNVRDDRAFRRLIADVRQSPVVTAAASYGGGAPTQPMTAGTYLDRGLQFARLGDNETAIADFTEAIRLDPNNTAAYAARATQYSGKGDHDRAIADYTQFIRIDPNDRWPYFMRAACFSDKKDYDGAIADYTQALRIPSRGHSVESLDWVLYNARASTYMDHCCPVKF